MSRTETTRPPTTAPAARPAPHRPETDVPVVHRRRRVAVVSALLGVSTLAAVATASGAAATPVTIHRAYGSDRYVTASLLEDPVRDVAYVVTGENYADGVAAGAVAARAGANLFLTPQGQLTQEVRDVIGYYRKVVVVGSEASVGPDVMTWLQQNTRATLSRVGGADRYATAANLSAASFAPGVRTVVVATGTDYADALSGSAVAGALASPVLLVQPGAVPDAVRRELARLKPQTITVLGGTGAVGAAVEADLRQYTTGAVTRIAGADRYATAVAVSRAFFVGSVSAQVASGTSWPDAIAAGAFAGRRSTPLLLTPQNCVPQAVNQEFERLGVNSLQAVGGDRTYSVAASQRTSCEAPPTTYLDQLAAPTGNAAYTSSHATIRGTFYPRSAAYATFAPTSSSPDLPNAEYRTWTLGGTFSRFTTVAGIADGTTSGLSATLDVYGDEKLLGSYRVAVGQSAAVDLDVRGVVHLKVVTTSSARTGAADDVEARTVYLGDAGVR